MEREREEASALCDLMRVCAVVSRALFGVCVRVCVRGEREGERAVGGRGRARVCVVGWAPVVSPGVREARKESRARAHSQAALSYCERSPPQGEHVESLRLASSAAG